MKVLILSRSDLSGGAARAAYRQMRGLRDAGVDARMLVVSKLSSDPAVIKAPWNIQIFCLLALVLETLLLKLQVSRNRILHSLNWFPTGMGRLAMQQKPDVINLHWVNGGMISLGEIRRLQAPVVWTLHDMWLMMGAEHYDSRELPGRHRQGYEGGRLPGDSGVDLNKLAWKWKRRNLLKRKIHFVAPSRWLATELSTAKMWQGIDCEVIPNCAPVHVYRPLSKEMAREILGLPKEKKIVLFGAVNAKSDLRKGYHHLTEAIYAWAPAEGTALCVVFGEGPSRDLVAGVESLGVGVLSDDVVLSLYYNAADVFICPSEQENLPNTLVEAQLCGTPCLAFKIGGNSEILSEGLVPGFDTHAMALGIRSLVENPPSWEERQRNAATAVDRFSPAQCAKNYRSFYQRVLGSVRDEREG